MCKECDRRNGTHIYSDEVQEELPQEVLTHPEPEITNEPLPQPVEMEGDELAVAGGR